MKLKRREKILLGVTVGLIAAAALAALYMTGDSRADDFLTKERDRLDLEVQKKKEAMQDAAADARRLAEWEKQSLPSDPVIARSLYQRWLHDLCDRAGLHGLDIHSEETEPYRDVYNRIPFSIRARASLDELTAFLHAFYSAGHLQQVRRLELKPIPNATNLEIQIDIEALSLPDAATQDKLSTQPGRSLRPLADYQKAISGRNFFAAYVPPPPPSRGTTAARRESPTVDFARFAVVTSFVEVDGAKEVWLDDQIAGKSWHLKEGDSFQVAGASGKVRKIVTSSSDGPDEVILEFSGKVLALHADQNLRQGAELKE